jgi:hypothetical protein
VRLEPFDRALLVFAALASVALAATFPRGRLTVLPGPLVELAGCVALLAAAAAFYASRRATRLADLVRVMLWTLVLNVLCSLLFYLPVRLGAPLADATLARADAALGFSSAHVVAWMRAHPSLDAFSAWTYESLEVFGIACVALPPLLGRVERAQTMLLAIVASVVATLALAAVVPAVGPWETEATPPTPAQAACADVVHRLAGGVPYAIDLHFRDPIVALPSWHTIFAVLGALVWRPVRVAWPIALAWGALIVVSTLTTGWHYLVDVLAGIAVAVAAHGVAGASLRTLRARDRARSPGARAA